MRRSRRPGENTAGDPWVNKVLEKRVNCHTETQIPTSSRDAEGYRQVQLPFKQFPAQSFHVEPPLSLDHLEQTSNFIQNPHSLRSVGNMHFPGTPCVDFHKVVQTGAWVESSINPH